VAVASELNQPRLIVVDDDKNCRVLLSRILAEMGCDVIEASGGHEALQEIYNTQFDLVFTDLNMIGMDGWKLAQNIRRFNRFIPIVMVTGDEKGTIMKKIRNSGVDDVIFKPFNIDDIEEILTKMALMGK